MSDPSVKVILIDHTGRTFMRNTGRMPAAAAAGILVTALGFGTPGFRHTGRWTELWGRISCRSAVAHPIRTFSGTT
jgi:hypothetical protein